MLVGQKVTGFLRLPQPHCTIPLYSQPAFRIPHSASPALAGNRIVNVFTVIIIATILALGPTLLYALLVWWLDRHEKEPIPLLVVAFVWGAIPAVIIALVLEIAAGNTLNQIVATDQAREVTIASLIAPIVEECVKAIILVALFLAFKRE